MSRSSSTSVEGSLRLSLVDAFLYSLMVGIGETYLPAFALSVGLGQIFAGALSSLPLVTGALLQLFTPRGLQKVGSHKSWVVLAVTFQALAFLPLIYFSFGETPHFWVLFLILTLYWGAGFAASPSWNYWMSHLVPEDLSQKYFSIRGRVSQFGILLGLILGGVALHNNIPMMNFTSVFGGMFFLAFLFRLGSSLIISRQLFKGEWHPRKQELVSVSNSWRTFWQSPLKRDFFLWLVPYMACVYVSAPFVPPYFLAQLHLDYGAYMIAIAALMIGKIAALSWISSRQEQIGGLRLLIFGVVMVSPAPIFWAFSVSYFYILLLQFVSGVAWAALEVGLSLIFLRDLGQEEKVPILTIYNLLNSLAIIIGTGLGAVYLKYIGATLPGYLSLFVLGGIGRIFFSRPLVKKAKLWQNSI